MKKILVGVLCSSLAGSVFAAAMPENPVYIDLNVGYLSAPMNNYTNASAAVNMNFGVLVNEYLGLEFGLTGSSIASGNTPQCVGRSCYYPSAIYEASDIAIKGTLPLSDVFALYGKLGVSYNFYQASSPIYNDSLYSAGLLTGIGAKFNLNKQWSLHLEDDYSVLLNNSLTNSGGLLYNTNLINNPNVFYFGTEFRF